VVLEADTRTKRLCAFAPANGSMPPTFTTLPVNWISGSAVVLTRLDRAIDRKFASALMVLPLALTSGPAMLTLDGPTSSAAGANPNVSETLKKLAPDRVPGPELTAESASWTSGPAEVLESWPP